MNQLISQDQIIKEIQQIPEEKLAELYDFIHYFRLGLEASKKYDDSIMQFAGCWQEMPEEVFEDFSQEIVQRRKRAFTRRKNNEIRPD